MISKEDIDRIMDAVRVEDVVGDFLELKRRGVNYIACCPFHEEKTPSFNVNPSRGIFKCFGCGEGGDSVRFLMKYQHYTYPEALHWLANKYNIEIKEEEFSLEELQSRDEKDKLYHINELACHYYHDNLYNSEEGQSIGMSYFRERQITRKTIDTWQLGYAKQQGNDFVQYALKAGYDEELLIKSGLCLKSEKDGSLYDRFRSRVTFPVYNIGGRVLGFSARILNKDKTKAKYVNSPESLIYVKGRTLFGLNFAKNEIAKRDICYLVEGNIDAIMMNQNEVKNVVASSGTALTEEQIRMIKRYTNNVTVLYDGDAAGIHAAIRATDMFLKEGMHISIVLFPDGDDPDSFARRHTQDEFKQFLNNNAQNFIIYRTNLALDKAKGDPIKKATLVKDIIHSISLIPDLIERSTYVQQCSTILNMRENVLMDQLNREIIHNAYLSNRQTKRGQQQKFSVNTENKEEHQSIDVKQGFHNVQQELPDNSLHENAEQISVTDIPSKEENLERNLLRILVNYTGMPTNQPVLVNNQSEIRQFNAGEYILSDIVATEIVFKQPLYKQIIDKYMEEYQQNGRVLSIGDIMRENDAVVNNLLSTLLMESSKVCISENWVKYGMIVPDVNSQQVIDNDIKYTILSVKLHKLSVMMEEIKLQMKQTPNEETLIERFFALLSIRNSIAKELNRTVF